MLVFVTLTLFPFLYLTLELPKRIINDAIGAGQGEITSFGITLSQVYFLWVLCGIFLLSVLCHGLLKVRINTMKGALAERLLRRFRYQLVTRMFRFPKPYFQRTSQAEIVSMVTSEAEPLGGMMGDAISQPILQAGQMLTILAFLFLQSFWFGLAAIALIPVQAIVIPILQRRINVLNKSRIGELRKFAAEIGETAAGVPTLRTSGSYGFRAAQVTHRLGRLFSIRLDIYKKKFFMKFLNNFITQLTPFFFFSIGGYLVIRGHVSLGALVAALAAYKDLSAPWKELLTYYNQFHEMSQRWNLITERFAPPGMIDDDLIQNAPQQIETLAGEIIFDKVSARDSDGIAIVEDISVVLPAGANIAITCSNEEERRAIAELLSRELLPSEGKITVAGHNLSALHQATIGAKVGWTDSTPHIFAGTIDDNTLLPLRAIGTRAKADTPDITRHRQEAGRAGNSPILIEDDWLDPTRLGLTDLTAVRGWWLKIVEGLGLDQELLRDGLALKVQPQQAPEITAAMVHLRKDIRTRLHNDGLGAAVHRFEPQEYNPALPLLENILFAIAKVPVSQTELAQHPAFLPYLHRANLVPSVFGMARALVDLLHATFGADGTDHPLFHRLGFSREEFETTRKICAEAERNGPESLKSEAFAHLLALPCLIPPDQIMPLLSEGVKRHVVRARPDLKADPSDILGDLFEPLHKNSFIPGRSLLENAIFGVVKQHIGARADLIYATVGAVLAENGLKSDVATLTLNEQTLLGGANLTPRVRERISLTRAAIKRPDILVLDKALAGYDDEARLSAFAQLRKALPQTTIIQIDSGFVETAHFDQTFEIKRGRLIGAEQETPDSEADQNNTSDLAIKLQVLRQSVFFADLDRKQLRLLAFSAQWFDIPAGEVIFRKGDAPTSGVYLIQHGEADFSAPNGDGTATLIRTAGPGSLVGELGLVLGVPRTLDMSARTDVRGLRIGGEEFLSVMRNDAETSFKMLQLIAGYLSKAPETPPQDGEEQQD